MNVLVGSESEFTFLLMTFEVEHSGIDVDVLLRKFIRKFGSDIATIAVFSNFIMDLLVHYWDK